MDRAFALIERFHVEGDQYVSELATIGFLESLLTWQPAVMAACEGRFRPGEPAVVEGPHRVLVG